MVDMGQADRSLHAAPRGEEENARVFAHSRERARALEAAANAMGFKHFMAVPEDRAPELSERRDALLGKYQRKAPVVRVNERVFTSLAEDRPAANQDGFYRRNANGILFFDNAKIPFAFLVSNRYNEQFFVSSSVHDGKIFHLHSTTDREDKFFGFDAMTYGEERDLAEAVVRLHDEALAAMRSGSELPAGPALEM